MFRGPLIQQDIITVAPAQVYSFKLCGLHTGSAILWLRCGRGTEADAIVVSAPHVSAPMFGRADLYAFGGRFRIRIDESRFQFDRWRWRSDAADT